MATTPAPRHRSILGIDHQAPTETDVNRRRHLRNRAANRAAKGEIGPASESRPSRIRKPDADRLAAAWMLTMFGMRRGEVVGLRWEHVDLDAGTLTIFKTRVSIGSRTIEEDPKSHRGRRTLPIDPTTVAALRHLRATQAA